MDVTVRLYGRTTDDAAGRRACLDAVVRDAAASAERLVIERDESTLAFDRHVLFDAARRYRCTDTLTYELLAPYADPMLWIPDADRDEHTEWLVGQSPGHGVAWRSLAPAATAPLIGLDNAACESGTVCVGWLAGDLKPEFIESAGGGQISAGEARADSRVGHVEVFGMGCVRTSILERSRPLTGPDASTTTG